MVSLWISGMEMLTSSTNKKILIKYYETISNKFKFQVKVNVLYKRVVVSEDGDEEEQMLFKRFYSQLDRIMEKSSISEKYLNQRKQIESYIHEAELTGSNWVFERMESFQLDIFLFKSRVGGSYEKLPFYSTSIVNIKNKDEYCFLWSVLAYLHPNKKILKEYQSINNILMN